MPEYAWVVEQRDKERAEGRWQPRDIFTVFAAAEGRLEQLRQSAMGAYTDFRIRRWKPAPR
jgi:hypothetical protein